ncbi:D-threonine aldolase [Polystyrenella longa]|uniref:D-threonine aldolase n=1 Tax=Polystyrenella longa TaxID=2528007 RepID=A0A518CR35_9PLAN|nr:D-TA family PLP-dependent enzyme [Polystyrenella longa]QDU81691.1 D-threonine aldolase [Polystyrenella longa]
MSDRYQISDSSSIISPGLVVFEELVDENIQKMIDIAGSVERLRPHCKTHKMSEVARKQLAAGITKHKAATFAEAEMLADAGAEDIFLAYNLVGPNIERAVKFVKTYPTVTFSVTADHERPLAQLSEAFSKAGLSIDVLLDVDTGLHRTGLEAGTEAEALYKQIADSPGIQAGGLHLYDGQNHQTDLTERTAAVKACWDPAIAMKKKLVAAGYDVPRIVAGGTGSFPIFAQFNDPALELSPGTCVFNDSGYSNMFPDMKFTPAAVMLTRVISRPTADRLTLDLGTKGAASDPPAGKRLFFPELPDSEHVLQNEEHLVLQTNKAKNYQPGDELIAIPTHICPTSALHKSAYVVRDGEVVAQWNVIARDRCLTI